MPPKGKARGAGPRAPSSGPAASSSPSLLPSGLRAAFVDLPCLVTKLTADTSAIAINTLIELTQLVGLLEQVPLDSPPHAAAMAELLSTQPDTAKAVLRLQAAALREGGEAEGAAAGGGSRGAGGGGGSPCGRQLWVTAAQTVVTRVVRAGTPLPASRHALTVLRFVRAMLRGQPLHALSRRLAAAAAALEGRAGGGGGGGGARGPAGAATAPAAVDRARYAMAMLTRFLSSSARVLLNDAAFAGLLYPEEDAGAPPPELAAAVAAERAAGVEDLARGLAESGVLEHAARVLLLLQARGPHAVRPREDSNQTLPEEVVRILTTLIWHASGRGRNGRLIDSPVLADGSACPPCVSPTASARILSALSGRCLQTAVLVYGVGTLRLVDRGPTYGLPAALQTAGLAMCEVGQRSPGPLILDLLRQLASRSALPPPGPGASLALALRVGRAAVGTLAAELKLQCPPGAATSNEVSIFNPQAVVLPLDAEPEDFTLLLAAAALRCSRGLLPVQNATPQQRERREEWWRLAAAALVQGVHVLDSESLKRLLELVTEPLLKGGQGRSGSDAVWLDLAAALNSGLLSVSTALSLVALRRHDVYGFISLEMFAACDRAAATRDGLGFAMLVTPLLAYGNAEEATLLLDAAASLLSFAGALVDGYDNEPAITGAAAAVLAAAASAAAAGSSASAPAVAAGDAAAALGAAAAMSPGEQLRGLLAYASQLWGLPLPPPLASGR
ncbi:hypothetical protein HYH03_009483 [Edaphochlamys debaryana]|uniref:Uncharacterized protein n=1 Tax=Edaphochlamys debaryana TaxID=47281 RepID=A0A835XYU0_9CHLO|nr:hypothetical protein HYH03_009483 [Edaphochlamys debaryana]|eukprot:KAG2492239.1 hypothetical protein HYH03_009483 [Edaphochlamys debaryana]